MEPCNRILAWAVSFTSWSTFVKLDVDLAVLSDLFVSAIFCATVSVLSFDFFAEVGIFRWPWRSPNVLSTSSKLGLIFFFAFLMDFFTANGLLLPFFERLALEFVVLGFPMSLHFVCMRDMRYACVCMDTCSIAHAHQAVEWTLNLWIVLLHVRSFTYRSGVLTWEQNELPKVVAAKQFARPLCIILP